MSDSAEQIVRALAAADPFAVPDEGVMLCVFCPGRDALDAKPVRPRTLADHASDCPWRLAVEFVAEQDGRACPRPGADLRDAAELAVTALLDVLPLEGDWERGYRVATVVQSEVRALPDEWAEAAHTVAALQRLIAGPTEAGD